MSLQYRRFTMPFPSRLNVHAQRAEEHGREFVRRYGLVTTDADKQRYDDSLIGTLIGRTFPHADAETLDLMTEWMACNLLLDDVFDESEARVDPVRLREMCDEVVSWLPVDGGEVAHSGSSFARAYADIWARTCAKSSVAWRAKFVAHFSLFLGRCVHEAANRRDDRTPGIAEYIELRSCALMPYLDLLELAQGWELPTEGPCTAEDFSELDASLSSASLWMNDLFSCEKEYNLGDVHNLVVVLKKERGTDLQTAADTAAEMIQAEIDDFERQSEDQLTGKIAALLDPALRSAAADRVEFLRSWLSGQFEWRFETKRNQGSNVRLVAGSAMRT